MSRPRGSKNKPKEEKSVIETAQNTETSPENKEEEIKPTAPHHYLARSALLKEINESNKEKYAAEGEEEDEEIAQSEPEEEEKEEIKEPVKGPEQPLVGKKKFKIDGQEIELTEEEIAERLQKSAAADKRLAEATRLLEDAKRQATTRQDVQPNAATFNPGSRDNQPSVAASSVTDVGDDSEIIKKITQAVLYGDEEQVANAFKPLLGKGRQVSDLTTQTQGMTPQQVQGYVKETLAFEKGIQLLETPSDQGGYADIWADPMLRGMFQRKENELRDAKDPRSYVDLYKAIGDEIRQWRDDLIKQHTPKTGLEDREAAKRSTGVVRGAGGKVPAPVQMKPKSHEDKLSEMRARRGLN